MKAAGPFILGWLTQNPTLYLSIQHKHFLFTGWGRGYILICIKRQNHNIKTHHFVTLFYFKLCSHPSQHDDLGRLTMVKIQHNKHHNKYIIGSWDKTTNIPQHHHLMDSPTHSDPKPRFIATSSKPCQRPTGLRIIYDVPNSRPNHQDTLSQSHQLALIIWGSCSLQAAPSLEPRTITTALQ